VTQRISTERRSNVEKFLLNAGPWQLLLILVGGALALLVLIEVLSTCWSEKRVPGAGGLNENLLDHGAFIKAAYGPHAVFAACVLGSTALTQYLGDYSWNRRTAILVTVGFVASWWLSDLAVTGRKDPEKNLIQGGLAGWVIVVLMVFCPAFFNLLSLITNVVTSLTTGILGFLWKIIVGIFRFFNVHLMLLPW
jgi:hypothetical protein